VNNRGRLKKVKRKKDSSVKKKKEYGPHAVSGKNRYAENIQDNAPLH